MNREGAALAALITVFAGGVCISLDDARAQPPPSGPVQWTQIPQSCADVSGQHLNASAGSITCGDSGPETGLIAGGVQYPLGDNSGTISAGLYTPIGGFPWSSGNITSVYAAVNGSGGSMTFGLFSATSEGATLSAVPGCSAITVSSGGSAAPTSCTLTPISRGGQLFISVTSITSGGTQGYVEPVFNHTPG
jgi:hypothetical protein